MLQAEIQELETLSNSKLEDIRKKLGSTIEPLFVGNLPYHYEKADLIDLLRDCGVITKVDMKKGYAFVEMAD